VLVPQIIWKMEIMTNALKKAERLGDPCEEVRQCQVLSSETEAYACNGTCNCNSNYLESSGRAKCLKIADALQQPCEEHSQCVHLGNFEGTSAAAGCEAQKCACLTPSKEDGGRCFAQKKIDSSCETDKDCTNGGIEGSVSCSEEGKCVCGSEEEEASEDKTKCNKKTTDSSATTLGKVFFIVVFSTVVNLWV